MELVRRQTPTGFLDTQTDFTATVNANTNEITIATYTLPANSLAQKKQLLFEALMHITTPALSIPTLTLKFKFGSASISLGTSLALGASISDKPFLVRAKITAISANSQLVYITIINNSGGVIFSTLSSSIVISDSTWAVDSTVDQMISLTAQFGGLGGSTSLVPKLLTYEVK